MDLLTSAGSSVPAAAVGKAVGTWAALRRFGGSTLVRLLRRWAPLEAVADFGNSDAARTLTWVLLVRGCKGKMLGARGEGEKVSRLMVIIGTVGLWRHNNVGLLMLYYAVKKHGEPMILRWSRANLELLYTMMPSERTENEAKTTLLELLVCWKKG